MNFLSFDLETHLIQPGLLAPPIVCGSVARGQNKDGRPVIGKPALLTKQQTLAEFRAALLTSEVICGAKIAYDTCIMGAYYPELLPQIFDKYERGEVWDVLIAQTLHFIANGLMHEGDLYDPMNPKLRLKHPVKGTLVDRMSLELVTWLCLGRTDAKQNDKFRLSYALLENTPIEKWPEEARQYPLDDAINTLEVALFQQRSNKNTHDIAAQSRAAFAEQLAAIWGLRMSGEKVRALELSLNEEWQNLIAEFKSIGFFRADGTKNTKMIQAFVEKAYNGNPPRTAGGQISTARDVLKDVEDPVLSKFANVSKVEKLLNTYVPFLRAGVDRPVNTEPNPVIANGRSSYKGLIQLLPRKGGVRECIVARPGKVLCSVDLSAGESSTFAQCCINTVGFSKLAEAINAGLDPHSLFATRIWPSSYEDVVAAVAAKDPVWVDRRQMTKAADFGYPGAMGAFKFAQSKRKEGLKLCLAARAAERCSEVMITKWKDRDYPAPACKACVEVGEMLRIAFLDMWTETRPYFRWVSSRLEANDKTLEQFVSRRIRGGLELPSGANTLFSGLLADMTKESLWQLSKECYVDPVSPLFGSRILVYTHDETIIEMPEDGFRKAAARHAEIMLMFKDKYLPDVALRAKPAVARYWSKDMADVWKDGELQIWEGNENGA